MSNLLPSNSEMILMKESAKTAVYSNFLGEAYNCSPDKAMYKAMYVIQKGVEVGMKPFQALNSIHVIKGKPTISAEGMLALIYANSPGVIINYLETSNTLCKIEAIKPNHKPAVFSFSIEDAKAAGLAGSATWKKYTRAMLRSRCVSEMARALFPECISGMSYTPEELGASVEISDDGTETIKDVTPQVVSTKTENTKHKTNSVQQTGYKLKPQAPVPTAEEIEEAFAENEPVKPEDFVVTFGKDILNKTLGELGVEKVDSVLKWASDKMRPSPKRTLFIEAASIYLDLNKDPLDKALDAPIEAATVTNDENPFPESEMPEHVDTPLDDLSEVPHFAPGMS